MLGEHWHVCESCFKVWGHVGHQSSKAMTHHCKECNVASFWAHPSLEAANQYAAKQIAEIRSLLHVP